MNLKIELLPFLIDILIWLKIKMIFSEEILEQAVVELFEAQKVPHVHGDSIHKEISDVLLKDDLRNYLLNKYEQDDITIQEIDSIIRSLEIFPSSALYESNKSIMKMISDGFTIKREDRNKKDLYIQIIDFNVLGNKQLGENSKSELMAADSNETYSEIDSNIYKFVNQLEILGYEKRIPDGILYINGIPLVVIEFKSAVKENTTIKDAYTQLTIRYRRDIPELFKYNAF